MKETTKLERLLNTTVIYKQNHIRIKDYFMKPEDGTVTIITDKNPITIKEAEIADFVSKCLPVAEESQALAIVTESQQTITTLKDILMDNIKKVQEDKEYIGQAKTINNSVSALLNMVSLQVKLGRK